MARSALVALVAIAVCAGPIQASIIEIPQSGADSVGDFGPNLNPAYGQVITVPHGDDLLVSYSLFLDSVVGGAPFTFESRVYKWNGVEAVVGPALFTSSEQISVAGEFSFSPGIQVESDAQYLFALFVTPSLAPPAEGFISINTMDPYTGGGAWVLAPGVDATDRWTQLRGDDLQGKFTFDHTSSQIPEPSTFSVWSLLGLVGAGFARHRHQRRKAA